MPTPTTSAPFSLRKLYTEHLGQLTGTALNSLTRVGLVGTDLGVSFERDGKVIFLFGDSRTVDDDLVGRNWVDDSVAWTPAPFPTDGSVPRLTWVTRPTGRFLPLSVTGVNLKNMNVPVEGVAVGTRTYLFFNTGWSWSTGRHTHSVLAHTEGLAFDSLVLDHVAPSDKFLNVSVVQEGKTLFIFGSGPFRNSAIYLARVDATLIADRSQWSYYRGPSEGAPIFGPDEATAVPVVTASYVGELSVRRHPGLGIYIMLFNSTPNPTSTLPLVSRPRMGVQFCWATSPAGPWSPPENIFDPVWTRDRGFRFFIHAKETAVGHDDGLSEPGREETGGSIYGPYLITQASTSGPGGVHAIVYTLSSRNPYQVHLVRTVLGEPGATVPPPQRGIGLPKALLVNGDFSAGNLSGWQSSGDGFALLSGSDGRPRLTTKVLPKGDGVVGKMWQDFTVDATTSELRFAVHGGDATVKLLRGADVVRTTRGRRANSPETPVVWQLTEYRGETVRLLIDDDKTGPWGFVGTTGFELR